jgi:TolA-binding protein
MLARTAQLLALLLLLVSTAMVRAQAPELPPVGGGGGSSPPPPPLPPFSAPGTSTPTTRPPAGGSDLELIERVLETRKQYANSLRDLYDYYRRVGDTKRAQMAEDELKQYHRMNHPPYRLELDVPNPKLQALYNQPEANDMYRRAMSYKDRGIGSDFTDNQKRAELLLQDLLTKYPQSNKIGDAAYMLGDIYEGRVFRQYERAAAYYERCFQWNPNTQFDARLRAAKLYDRELKDRSRAIELYRLVIDYETSPTRRDEAARRLKDLGAR